MRHQLLFSCLLCSVENPWRHLSCLDVLLQKLAKFVVKNFAFYLIQLPCICDGQNWISWKMKQLEEWIWYWSLIGWQYSCELHICKIIFVECRAIFFSGYCFSLQYTTITCQSTHCFLTGTKINPAINEDVKSESPR